MKILITAAVLLLMTFIMHIIWWRLRLPKNAFMALLSLFGSVLIGFSLYGYFHLAILAISIYQLTEFILLYASCALVYIILYSAIEQQSPTLLIIDYLRQFGANGCEEASLYSYIRPEDEMTKRLLLMEQSGLVKIINDCSILSPKGERMAALFYYGARLFGLKSGGG